MSIIIMGCDPGETTGFSIFENEIYRESRIVKMDDINSYIPMIFQCRCPAKSYYFGIETTWLPPKSKLNPRTFAKQNQTIGRLKQIAIECGWQIIDVVPSEWQSALHCGARAKREQLKRASCLVASQISKKEIKNSNEADAINIGAWAARKLIAEQKINQII